MPGGVRRPGCRSQRVPCRSQPAPRLPATSEKAAVGHRQLLEHSGPRRTGEVAGEEAETPAYLQATCGPPIERSNRYSTRPVAQRELVCADADASKQGNRQTSRPKNGPNSTSLAESQRSSAIVRRVNYEETQ